MEAYDTLVHGIEGLRKQGYTKDFNLNNNCIEASDRSCKLLHNEFEIDKFFRFEGETNPADSSILYAISSLKDDTKGVLVNAYGIYSDDMTDEMIKKLNL
ncbi:hypothetical protein C7377_1286 [Balneicella halophila]|uniref:Phosphoribosylpyrophosphate synthetase n=2 Tax=Balneicella halophila TaxID=1537566 RepID=A0A7L4UQ71_BALHA|nr:hypothetical protein C7377_1286 [Balneicella halophila]